MLHMRRLTINELQEAASFIAKMNNDPKHYIGYCGSEVSELYEALKEDFIDESNTNIVVALQDNRIIALIGLDIYDGKAEVWGPFCEPKFQHVVMDLWLFTKSTFTHIEQYLFFIGNGNITQQNFLESLGAILKGEDTYFEMEKTILQSNVNLTYEEKYLDEFESLHTKAFPNTYYDAETILSRYQAQEGTLSFYVENNEFIGYSYYEPNGENECHIEYMAVNEIKRGQGYGENLLYATLQNIFSKVDRVTLTVNTNNIVANKLYLKVGFIIRKVLKSYSLN